MKRILYLTFYFEPDLCAGSFRNTPLLKELAKQCNGNCEIDVFTTQPNRYESFKVSAESKETFENVTIYRINLPEHKSGMRDQIYSFKEYFLKTKEMTKGKKYDLVFASSSRLFTAYLGYNIAKISDIPLYLDIRDIFVDTMGDVLSNKIVKTLAMPVLKEIERRVFGYATHVNLISEGFKLYFSKYQKTNYSFFSNGIDDVFIENKNVEQQINDVKTIVYAGNIGEGQGLHKIIPKAAKKLGHKFQFKIIGDGGAKTALINELDLLKVENVVLYEPVSRDELIAIYNDSDFLFLHLNDYAAFEKVLPSKIFELGTFNKPIIAGVAGYAYNFMKDNIDNIILFKPCDVNAFVNKLQKYEYKFVERGEFMLKFKRSTINKKMAKYILEYL